MTLSVNRLHGWYLLDLLRLRQRMVASYVSILWVSGAVESMRLSLLASSSILAMQFATANAFAGGLDLPRPALSQVKSSVAGFVASDDQRTQSGGAGTVTMPVGAWLDVQFDGVLGSSQSDMFSGVAGHLFTQDPTRGAFGLMASYSTWDRLRTDPATDLPDGVVDTTGASVGKIGIEAERYLGRFTLKLAPSYQFGTRDGAIGRGAVNYYPTDNSRIDLGGSYVKGVGRYISMGAEWSPETPQPMTFFMQAGVDGHDEARVVGGLKVAFGQPGKSLIAREREDGLEADLPANLFDVIGDSYCPVGSYLINGYCDGNG